MPKFFVTSDIHSFYKPLTKALDEAGFDPNNKDHWLVVCGDCFDRGPDSKEVLRFIMQLERKIIVKGNHDILLEDLCMREFAYSHDFHNGTTKTVQDLGNMGEGYPLDECCQTTWNKTARYRELLVNYFETQNYIFVHSWIPTNKVGIDAYEYKEDWRNATAVEWDTAMWGNPFYNAQDGLNKTGKTIVFGHFHTSFMWDLTTDCGEFGEGAIFDPYFGKDYAGNGYIGIDACTAYTGKCNVIVLEDEFLEES